MKLTRININLIPSHGTRDVDETKYWNEMTKLIDLYSTEKDLLKKMMKIQEINNDTHTIDYGMIRN